MSSNHYSSLQNPAAPEPGQPPAAWRLHSPPACSRSLLHTVFLDIKLLNQAKSTLNTSLILIKAVNNYAMVARKLQKRDGMRDGGSQMKGCLQITQLISRELSQKNTTTDLPCSLAQHFLTTSEIAAMGALAKSLHQGSQSPCL